MRYRELRYPCDYPAELSGPGGAQAISIINISLNGARIMPGDGLNPGDPVVVHLLRCEHPATVRWSRVGMAGLRFTVPLTQRVVATVRKSIGNRVGRVGWNLHLREIV